jgi:hypothetical protein
MVIVQPAAEDDKVLAYFGVETRDGLTIKGLTYHQDANGYKWIGFPGQPRLDSQDRAIRGQDGRKQFYKIIYIADKDKFNSFQNWAIAELDRILPALKQAKSRTPEFRGAGGGR